MTWRASPARWVLLLILSASLAGCVNKATTPSASETVTPASDSDAAPAEGQPPRDAPPPTRSERTSDVPPPPDPGTPEPPLSVPPPARPRVVVAVIDGGLNPYHAEFRRSAVVLNEALPARIDVALKLNARTWADAFAADRAALTAMEPGVLYAFPGTKIVAAISFYAKPNDFPVILDRPDAFSHGTMTASRAVGNTVSILGADPDVDLVFIQGFLPEAVRWAGQQPWIDIISISAGVGDHSAVPAAPLLLDRTDAVAAFTTAAAQKPLFASTGNGVLNAGLVGYPSWLRGASGVPDVISVGANDNDRLSLWHNGDAYISADGCRNPAAISGSLVDVRNIGGGTSSATPFSAGGGASLLVEARRLLGDLEVGPRTMVGLAVPEGAWDSLGAGDAGIVLASGPRGLVASGPLFDGAFTLAEFKDVLYHSALVTPTEDESDGASCDAGDSYGTFVPAAAVDEAARFPFQGYGEVNADSIERGLAVLRGESPLPARESDDVQYAQAHERKTRAASVRP